MKIKQCHKIGLTQKIDKIIQDQIDLDYYHLQEEKNAEVIGTDSEPNKISTKKKIERSPIVFNKCVSVQAFNKQQTMINNIMNEDLKIARIISSKSRPMTALSRKPRTEGSIILNGRDQALNVQKLTMNKLLSPINLYPKQFTPNFN